LCLNKHGAGDFRTICEHADFLNRAFANFTDDALGCNWIMPRHFIDLSQFRMDWSGWRSGWGQNSGHFQIATNFGTFGGGRFFHSPTVSSIKPSVQCNNASTSSSGKTSDDAVVGRGAASDVELGTGSLTMVGATWRPAVAADGTPHGYGEYWGAGSREAKASCTAIGEVTMLELPAGDGR
jgi:hypothetical protein